MDRAALLYISFEEDILHKSSHEQNYYDNSYEHERAHAPHHAVHDALIHHYARLLTVLTIVISQKVEHLPHNKHFYPLIHLIWISSRRSMTATWRHDCGRDADRSIAVDQEHGAQARSRHALINLRDNMRG
jgi:hypothetical protein